MCGCFFSTHVFPIIIWANFFTSSQRKKPAHRCLPSHSHLSYTTAKCVCAWVCVCIKACKYVCVRGCLCVCVYALVNLALLATNNCWYLPAFPDAAETMQATLLSPSNKPTGKQITKEDLNCVSVHKFVNKHTCNETWEVSIRLSQVCFS